MTPAAPEPTLVELTEELASPDDDRVRAALRASSRCLAPASGEDRAAFVDALGLLLERRSPRVREAVANLADHLPEAAADRVLAALLADGEHYVQRAAARAAQRRSAKQKAQAREDEHERVLGSVLERIESRHGKPARRLAERGIQLAEEAFVRKVDHEVSKNYMPMEFALHAIGVQVAKPVVDVAEVRRHIEAAEHSIKRMKAALAASVAVAMSLKPEITNERIAGLVETARGEIALRLGANASRLVFVNDVSPTLELPVDRSLLLQALVNVLQNGAEAHDEAAPRIELTVTSSVPRGGGHALLAITDKGRGMTKAEQSRVFIPFNSRKPGGTGIGMVTSRRMIVEAHDGKMTVKSTPGAGTTVTFALPLSRT